VIINRSKTLFIIPVVILFISSCLTLLYDLVKYIRDNFLEIQRTDQCIIIERRFTICHDEEEMKASMT
jgi:hypothetical protein